MNLIFVTCALFNEWHDMMCGTLEQNVFWGGIRFFYFFHVWFHDLFFENLAINPKEMGIHEIEMKLLPKPSAWPKVKFRRRKMHFYLIKSIFRRQNLTFHQTFFFCRWKKNWLSRWHGHLRWILPQCEEQRAG